jgi:type IV pilus assembly protein PilP
MKNFFPKISALFWGVTVLSLFLNPICAATTAGKPVVIRKKIAASTQKAPENINRSDASFSRKSRMPKPKSDISIQSKDRADKMVAAARAATSRRLRPLYDPADRVDPFEPLIRETPKMDSDSVAYAYTGPQGTTVIENIDLSQLKLTGIILAASGNKALVREASGRGHIISEGTPIGTHRGRVDGVLKDRIIVKEKMKDLRGKFFFKETELKLNKPHI